MLETIREMTDAGVGVDFGTVDVVQGAVERGLLYGSETGAEMEAETETDVAETDAAETDAAETGTDGHPAATPPWLRSHILNLDVMHRPLATLYRFGPILKTRVEQDAIRSSSSVELES